MSQWKNIAPVLALSISAALAGTGCAAQQDADDEATNDTDVAANEPAPDAKATPAMPTTDEKAGDGNTADAKQAGQHADQDACEEETDPGDSWIG